MSPSNRRRWLSVLLAASLLVGFLWLLGPGRVAGHLRGTDVPIFVVGLVSTVASLVAWSETQRNLLAASGVVLSPWRAFLVYNAGMFAKQVLPMGHAAGPALATYAVGAEVDRPHAENLAPVSIAEFQMLTASVCLAVVGVGYTLGTAPATRIVRILGVATAVTVAELAGLALVVWYRRRVVERALLGVAWFLQQTVGRLSARVRERIEPASVSAGSERYYRMIGAVTGDRRRAAVAFAWALGGWLTFSAPLVTSAWALGADLPVAMALFLAPAAGIAGLAPLPGGLGGAEIGLTGLLVALGGLPAPLAAGITLLYRACTYWFVVFVSGAFAAYRGIIPGRVRQQVERGP